MSFSEMMESGRGPGVIGMLMALVVMAIFVMLFIFAFDERFMGGGQTIESIIADQATEVADLETLLSDAEKQVAEVPARQARVDELTALKREGQNREAQIAGIKTEIATADGLIASNLQEFETYKDKYRVQVRGKAKGEIIERLEARDGNIYENVTIRNVTPIGIQIMHDGGLKRIPYEQLPDPMIDRFQFDAKQKAAAIALEEAQRTEHETAVSEATAAESQNLAEKKKTDAAARRDAMIRSIATKKARIKTLDDEVRKLEQDIVAEGYKRLSRAPQMRIQLANKQQELSELQADVARLEADASR